MTALSRAELEAYSNVGRIARAAERLANVLDPPTNVVRLDQQDRTLVEEALKVEQGDRERYEGVIALLGARLAHKALQQARSSP